MAKEQPKDITPEEKEAVEQYLDTMSYPEALKRVLGQIRANRVLAREALEQASRAVEENQAEREAREAERQRARLEEFKSFTTSSSNAPETPPDNPPASADTSDDA